MLHANIKRYPTFKDTLKSYIVVMIPDGFTQEPDFKVTYTVYTYGIYTGTRLIVAYTV